MLRHFSARIYRPVGRKKAKVKAHMTQLTLVSLCCCVSVPFRVLIFCMFCIQSCQWITSVCWFSELSDDINTRRSARCTQGCAVVNVGVFGQVRAEVCTTWQHEGLSSYPCKPGRCSDVRTWTFTSVSLFLPSGLNPCIRGFLQKLSGSLLLHFVTAALKCLWYQTQCRSVVSPGLWSDVTFTMIWAAEAKRAGAEMMWR